MSLRCKRCNRIVESFDVRQKVVFVPHKFVENDVYCDSCFETIEEKKHFFKRVKKFFRVTKAKVIITFSLYAFMILYSIIFFKPSNEYNLFVEGFIQFGYIINYPLLVFNKYVELPQTDVTTVIFLTVSSILFVLFWNYFLSCIIYSIYKKIADSPN